MPLTRINAILTMRKNFWHLTLRGMLTFIKDNFRHFYRHVCEACVFSIDLIFVMTWVSRVLIDQRERGFSFIKRMRLWTCGWINASLTAYEVVNNYDNHDLVRFFFKYGYRTNSLQILRKIEQAREKSSQSRLTLNWQKLSSPKPLPRLSRRRAIAKNRSSRLFGLKFSMSWGR